MSKIAKSGLYSPARERDACGFGFVARVDGRRTRETGAGGGILLQIPDAFPRRECEDLGIELTPAGGYGVGVLFEFEREEGPDCEGALERIVAEEGQRFLGWRTCRSSRVRPGAWRRASYRASGSSSWRTGRKTRRQRRK